MGICFLEHPAGGVLASSAHPACPRGRGCLPTPPSEPPITSLGPPPCPARTLSDALLGRGCSHPRGPQGEGGLQVRGCQHCVPPPPPPHYCDYRAVARWQSKSDRAARERVNQRSIGGAPGSPGLDEAKRAGFGLCPEPQHPLRTTRTGQSAAVCPTAQPELRRAPVLSRRTNSSHGIQLLPETTLQLQPNSSSPGRAAGLSPAAPLMPPARVMRASLIACFPVGPGTPGHSQTPLAFIPHPDDTSKRRE